MAEQEFIIEKYSEKYKDSCLAVFDQNSPDFFAPNERIDFLSFLNENPSDYYLLFKDDVLIAGYGLRIIDKCNVRIHWIMVNPLYRGEGLGNSMMQTVIQKIKGSSVIRILIAASQKSAPFFAKYGAKVISTTKNGWGKGMDKVDMEINL